MTVLPSIADTFEALMGEALPEGSAERTARCLAHDNHNTPSCSYNVEKNTWKCFSCDAQGGVLDLIVKSGTAADNAAAWEWLKRKRLVTEAPEAEPAEKAETKVPCDWNAPDTIIYDYCHADGSLAYQVARDKHKNFGQRQPNGKGGWLYNLKDVERVPYCLPEVLQAVKDGRQILFVEGEKDADNLRNRGFVATTCAGGAKADKNKATPAEFWHHFKGAARIVVLGDNDKPGREAAQYRADRLSLVCRDVRVIEAFPGVPLKGDVSDWLAMGNDADALKALLSGDAPRKVDAFGIAWQPDIVKDGVEPTLWDIEGIIEAENGPVLLTAPPETYKSWTAMFICQAMVTGKPLFGEFEVQNKRPFALYINLDAGGKATRKRVAKLGPDPVPNFGVMSWDAWDEEKFEALLAAHPGAFVVIDCWANVFLLGESRVETAEAMRTFLQPIRNLYEKYGCNGIIVDHTPRNDGKRQDPGELFYGSQQKKATIRQGITLVRDEDEDEANEAGSEDEAHDAASNERPGGSGKKRMPPMRNVINFYCLKMSEEEKFAPFQVEWKRVDDYITATFVDYISPNAKAEKKRKQERKDGENIRKTLHAIRDCTKYNQPTSLANIIAWTKLTEDVQRKALKHPQFAKGGAGKNTVYLINDGYSEIVEGAF